MKCLRCGAEMEMQVDSIPVVGATSASQWLKLMQLKYALEPPKTEEISTLADEVSNELIHDDDPAIMTLAKQLKDNIKQMPRESKLEIRVWENSSLVGMTIGEIKQRFNVSVLKVTRGAEARNPPPYLKLDAGDYIFIVGESDDCLKFIRYSKGTEPIFR